jgi:hypothetical protein
MKWIVKSALLGVDPTVINASDRFFGLFLKMPTDWK